MKHFLLVFVLFLFTAAPAVAQVNEHFITDPIKIEVTEKPGFLKKALHYATLGMMFQSTDTVQAQKPFAVLADHNAMDVGLEADGYKLWINGVVFRTATVGEVWVANASGGTVTFANVTLAKGTHTIQVSAFNGSGDTQSATLTVISAPGKPKAPLNLRLVK